MANNLNSLPQKDKSTLVYGDENQLLSKNHISLSFAEMQAHLQTLEKFISKELLPNPNDSCCGGSECRGGVVADLNGVDACNQSPDFFMISNSSSKDQMGKADDCFDFAEQLQSKVDSIAP